MIARLRAIFARPSSDAALPPMPAPGTNIVLGSEQMALVWIAMLRSGAEHQRAVRQRKQTTRTLHLFLEFAMRSGEAEARKSITTHQATGGRNAARLLTQLAEALA